MEAAARLALVLDSSHTQLCSPKAGVTEQKDVTRIATAVSPVLDTSAHSEWPKEYICLHPACGVGLRAYKSSEDSALKSKCCEVAFCWKHRHPMDHGHKDKLIH